MIFDRTLLFSNAQAITADAASTDVVDLLATGTVYGAAAALTKDIGKGADIPLLIQVVETFNNLTDLRVIVQTDDNSGFTTPRNVMEIDRLLADLVAGRNFTVRVPNGTAERYLRIYYDITGTAPTLGKMTAGVVMGVQSNGVNF